MSGLTELDVLTIAVFCGALVAGASILNLAFGTGGTFRARQNQRLARVGARSWEAAAAEVAASIRKKQRGNRDLDDWLRRSLPRRDALATRLQKTGRDISMASYVFASLATAGTFGLMAFMFGAPPLIAIMVGVGTGVFVPYRFIGFLIERRTRRFLGQFPEAIDQIVRGVRSGLPVGEAIAGVGRDLEPPISTEFQNIVDNVKLGRTLDEALWETSRRLDIPEFNFLVISMVVQRETGGNLAETLENLADILRRRQQMKDKARAMSSEARASALIVGSLPLILAGVLYLVNPEYLMKLFTDPRGIALLGAGMTSEVIGFMVMIRMAKFEI